VSSTATLVLAWGNPGRRDDGLGPAFAEAIRARGLADLAVSADYQLQIEDAAELCGCARVLFVDADRCGPEPFRLHRLEPEAGGCDGPGFTSHGISPARVLRLGRELFGAAPEAWLMGIRGYDFDGFGEELSAAARINLESAIAALLEAVAAGGEGGVPRLAAVATRG
jgi:hydrogenase maturation protease